MKRVLIVNDEMMVGGVARVLVNMLKVIDFDDVKIDILILNPHGEMLKDIPSKYEVIPSTEFFSVCDITPDNAIKMGLKTYLKRLYFYFLMKSGLINKRIQQERKKIIKEEYDVEIAYKEGFSTIFVANGGAKKKVNWIHVDYKKNNYSKNHMELVKKALEKIDVNVSQSEDAKKSYKEVFELKKDNFEVIKNMIDEEMIRDKAKETVKLSDEFNIVSAGRLHYQKAFLRMMEVCRRLNADGLKYQYYIVGDGEERLQIENKISEYKLDNVHLVGYVPNPWKYMNASDLFLLPSIYESAPTVVYEALAIKKHILSAEVAGVKDQLADGLYGRITDNSEDGLYNALKDILNNKDQLKIYDQNLINYKNTNNEESKEKIRRLFND